MVSTCNSPQNSHTLGQFKAIVNDAGHFLKAVHVVLKLVCAMGSVPQRHRNRFIGQLGHLEDDVKSPTRLAEQVKVELEGHLEGLRCTEENELQIK